MFFKQTGTLSKFLPILFPQIRRQLGAGASERPSPALLPIIKQSGQKLEASARMHL